ncbi:MAG: hypothetical protein ACQETL_17655 [Bacteroidota bacterium]
MRIILLISILCASIAFDSFSQRVRYKNVFPLLQSKDYETAEPLLLQFLEKNDDEANAYFYLGEITVSKLDTVKIFPTTEKYDSMANLAIKSYEKAITLVDDREVRKNDEYYMAYNRRDLRTGKFGIKKSDVHLDYENKIEDVSSKKALIKELHQLKEKSINEYDDFKNEVTNFHSNYPDEASFKLRAKSEDREALNQIIMSFNKFKTQYESFVEKLTSLKHPLYKPELILIPIDNWDELVPKDIDFNNFIVELQDYDTYLTKVNNKIESEVEPIKQLLFKTDNDFDNTLSFNKKVNDSSQIKEMLISEELKNGLANLDNKNVIYNLLRYKQLKNNSTLLTNENLYPVLSDSSNIYQRTNIIKKYKERLGDQLEVINLVESQINDRIKADFADYFEGFDPSIDAYIKTEKTILEKKYEEAVEKSKEMEIDIQYFTTEEDTIYTTPLIAASNNGDKYVLDLIESDSSLLMIGSWQEKPFIANAGFDMKIRDKNIVEDTALIVDKMLNLNDNILINLKHKEEEKPSQLLIYLSYQMEELWRLEFESESTLGDAKVEAGIFFLYDEEGEVLHTLNAQGEIIGN